MLSIKIAQINWHKQNHLCRKSVELHGNEHTEKIKKIVKHILSLSFESLLSDSYLSPFFSGMIIAIKEYIAGSRTIKNHAPILTQTTVNSSTITSYLPLVLTSSHHRKPAASLSGWVFGSAHSTLFLMEKGCFHGSSSLGPLLAASLVSTHPHRLCW